jgi:hypothetical protein
MGKALVLCHAAMKPSMALLTQDSKISRVFVPPSFIGAVMDIEILSAITHLTAISSPFYHEQGVTVF